jgi:hypothetical protein
MNQFSLVTPEATHQLKLNAHWMRNYRTDAGTAATTFLAKI